MAAHEDVQKSSSMPSTPQPLLFFDADGQPNQPASDDIWHNAKRRRTHRTGSETQFIHMNGYKSDSQVGTRFNNTYVDSYTDSKTFDSVQTQSADATSTPESTPVVEVPPQNVSEERSERSERSEPVSVKATRSNRKPAERSTETSSRVLKVKSGSGSSQQTNIQTFIFKTKLDPRLAHQGRSDEPATPSSINDTTELQAENVSSVEPAKPTRRTRKSDTTMLKFKSYTPNTTPVGRTSTRKPSRQEYQPVDTEAATPTSKSPTMTIDDYYPSFTNTFDQEKEKSPSKMSQFETPYKEEEPAEGSGEPSSTQRRSTRARKPVSTLNDEARKNMRSLKRTASAKTTKEGKPILKPLDVEMADAYSCNANSLTNSQNATAPSTPVSEIDLPHGITRDDGSFEGFGTPSPESLSAATRTSGRLRKPTIKAIEALQSKPRTRKRMRDSDQGLLAEPHTNDKSTPEPGNNADLSAVSMSRSTSGAVSEVVSVIVEDPDMIGRQLYELAAAAFADTTTAEEDHAGVLKLREAFNQNKAQQALIAISEVPATEEPVFDIHRIDHLGEIDPDVPLDHSKTPRPWVESDGWTHTGRVNEFGEEYCTAPASRYQWVKHSSNYRTPVGPVPTPPPFIKSVEELRRDNIFGFPPSPGQRNLSQEHPGQVWQHEDVDDFLERQVSFQAADEAMAQGLGRSIVPRPSDGMDADDSQSTSGNNDETVPRFKKPIRLVLVDSSKLGNGRSRASALRRRRQSAPVSTEQKFAATATNTPTKTRRRKRSLGDISIDMKDVVLDDDVDDNDYDDAAAAEPTPQRKKRRSTALLGGSNAEENSPARHTPKPYGRGSSLMTPGPRPRGTPRGRRGGGTRGAHSARAASKSNAFTSINNNNNHSPTTAPAGRGGRRRTLGATPK
ncbi:uncharacterized protein TRUGW13939_00755 [Talaromyces rugulosus]|uniref:Uncharacterized protein n=1 Tax=Talaromyces rugulosus TaxID=121627 RepID=A0A7H8QJN3_TALRU|nr:uncharacterized protein TRUGW13939_00755 [Talaromyces rugulosus]QKX53675.1 hypothetical protein TRUGW13939_00755 [Talaromyces rugulosus]